MVYELQVENIKCGGCANSIKNTLQKLDGVEDIAVDIERGVITVNAADNVKRETLIEKLRDMGYPEPGKGSVLATATSYVSCMIGRVTS